MSASSSVNEQLAEELHKPIISNFKKRTVHSGFKDNIWCADLTDVQLISQFSKGFKFLPKFLCNNKHAIKRTYDAISLSFFIFIHHIIYS